MLKLTPRSLQQNRSEIVRSAYTFTIPTGVPFAAVLRPDYWSHVAEGLKPNDLLEVIAEDGSFDEELRVYGFLFASDGRRKLGAKVRVKRIAGASDEPAEIEEQAAAGQVKFRGRMKWSALAADRTVIAEGLDTREEAEAALEAFTAAKAA